MAEATLDLLNSSDFPRSGTLSGDELMAGIDAGGAPLAVSMNSIIDRLTEVFDPGLVTYSTVSAFSAAVSAGDLDTAPEGALVVAAGKIFVKDSSQVNWLTGIANWREPWMAQDQFLAADLQARPDSISPGETLRQKAMLDSVGNRWPNLASAIFVGDLGHEGSQDGTGNPPAYTNADFKADVQARLRLSDGQIILVSGNHDRDGTGISAHQKAWSMQTFRSEVGPEFFAMLQGNLLDIFLGDMGGTVGGAISDAAVEWFREMCFTFQTANIRVFMHHPLSGVYQGQTEATHPTAVQAHSDRLQSVFEDVASAAGNIVGCFYGHVGSNNQFNDEIHFGTRHVQIGTHIPSNVDNGRNDQYYVCRMKHGATTFDIEQWDATTDTFLSTKTFNLSFPLALAPTWNLDGRHQWDRRAPLVEPFTVNVPVDRYRVFDGANWVIPTTRMVVATFGATDRSNDSVEDGSRISIQFDMPGVLTTGKTFDEAAAKGSVEGAAFLDVKRTGGTQDVPTMALEFFGMVAGVVSNFFRTNGDGVHLGHNGTSTANPGNSAVEGCTVNPQGFLSAFRSGGISAYLGRDGAGDMQEFNVGTTRVGAISTSGTGVTYGTVSDERRKEGIRDLPGATALSVLRRAKPRYYRMTGSSVEETGFLAGELRQVCPDAVSGGGTCPERDPYLVDYGRLVPVNTAALLHLEDRINELESRVVALETRK